MGRNLRLEVVLKAVDRATKPIKAVTGGSVGLARTLKQTREALKGLQSQQQDVSSWRTLRAASQQTDRALQTARDRVKALSREMAATGVPTRQFQRDMRGAIREATALKQQHQQQQQQLQGLRSQLSSAGISTRNLGDHERTLRQRIVDTNRSLSDQESRLRRLTQQQQRLARAKSQYSKTQGHAGSLATSGAGSLAGAYTLGRPLMAALGIGYEFDATMSATQAVTRIADKADAAMTALRDQARTLPLTSKFTDLEVAQGQYYLGRTGYNANQILGAMPGMLNLAAAGDMDLGQTADIASNIQTAMGIPAEKMGRVADVLTAAFTRNNVDIQMLGESLKYSAGVGREYGQSLETVTTATALLGNAGVQGSMAGTSMRAVLTRLGNSKAVAKLGVQTKDANGDLRDMLDILKDIHDKTQAMGNVERGAVYKDIAGQYAVTSFGTLMRAVENGQFQGMRESLNGSINEAAQVAGTQLDNLKGDMTMLHAAIENISVELFDKNSPWMRELAKNISHLLHNFAEFLKANPQLSVAIVKTVGSLTVLLTVMGGITLALAAVLGPFAMLRLAMMLLGIKSLGMVTALKAIGSALLWLGRLAMANPIGLLITALVVGAYLIYKNWDGVKAYMLGLWAELKAGFSGGLGSIAATILNFSPLGLFHRALAGVLSYFGVDIPARFTDFGGMLIDGLVNGITAGLGRVKQAITGAGGAAVDWFKQKLGIHSPSRVFAQLGGYTMAGLTQGLVKGEGSVLSQIAHTADQLSGGMLGAGGITFDRRPAITAGGRQPVSIAGDTISIHIHASPGQDAQAIARAVAQELDKRERAKAARHRAALYDQE